MQPSPVEHRAAKVGHAGACGRKDDPAAAARRAPSERSP